MLQELTREAPRPSQISDAGDLVVNKLSLVPVQTHNSPEGWTLETKLLRLELQKNPFRLSWVDKSTHVRWSFGDQSPRPEGIAWAHDATASSRRSSTPLVRVLNIHEQDHQWILECQLEEQSKSVKLEIRPLTPGLVRISTLYSQQDESEWSEFHLSAEGPFFGLGEQYYHANLAGIKINLHPNDNFKNPDHSWDYMSIPFVYGPHGLGIYFDTAFTASFDMTQASDNRFSVQIQGPAVDCYLFAMESPAKVLGTYTGLTGRSPVPPVWAFGVWHTVLKGASAALDDARRLRAERIPVTALWPFDMLDDSTNLGWPLWTTGYYGDPRKFNTELHNLGFKVLGYVHPYVRSELLPYLLPSPNYEYALAHNFLVVGSNGQPAGSTFEPDLTGNIDFTNPAAVSWWGGMIRCILTGFHFDGWMEDFGEWVHDKDKFAAGRTGRVMATLYPLFYHKVTYEVAHKADPDVVEFSRSGAPGSQAFTTVLWGGDQRPDWSKHYGLPAVVTAGITAGLSGFDIWGPDILSSGTSKELWIRWMEFGALSPIMRDHLWDVPKFAVDLWFDPETIKEFRLYAGLHDSLSPYLYTFAQQASKSGLPIMRHLMLAWPDDPNTYTVEYEYLLGDRILVAPVIEQGAASRRLYLPKGSWVDYWNSQVLTGGHEVTIPAPLHEIPILIKAGAVIPLISPQTQTLAKDLAAGKYQTLGNSLIWRVFPAAGPSNSSFNLYDGSTIRSEQDVSGIHLKGTSPIIRAYEVDLSVSKAPSSVLLNNIPLHRIDAAGVRAGKSGWRFDPYKQMLQVLFTGSNFDLGVSCR
jgi:alpha-glucosidase (family GH31 glycosyl hydrolase)